MLGWDSPASALIAFGAAVLAGAINAVAGGGTIVAFPTLIWLGIAPVEANATNAAVLWPGSMGAAWGFRRELTETRVFWLWLSLIALAGGGLGAYVLLNTPPRTFEAMAPWLVLGATGLFAVEQRLSHAGNDATDSRPSRTRQFWAVLALFGISVYGGYFGAGLGILLLAILGLVGVTDLHKKNGLKNLFFIGIKGAAVIGFAAAGRVVWHAALLMAVGAIAGGWLGARVQHAVGRRRMRYVIVAIGAAMGITMLVQLSS